MERGKYNIIIIPIFLAFVLLLPNLSSAQITTPDTFLKEYFLPVTSYQGISTATTLKGAECDEKWDYGMDFVNYPEDAIPPSCQNLGTTLGNVIKLDNGALQFNTVAAVGYKFDVAESANYSFKIQVANNADNLLDLSQADIWYYNACGGPCGWRGSWIGSQEYITEEPNTPPDLTYLNIARKSYFAIYVNKVRVGTMVVPTVDAATKVQDISLNLGALQAGTNQVQILLLNDTFYNYGMDGIPPCGLRQAPDSPFCLAPEGWQAKFDAIKNHLRSLDKDQNGALDSNPVIFSVSLEKTMPVEDIIGIRVYSNSSNKYPAEWYKDNVLSPSTNLENVTVDGYQAVRDNRTVYVSAANVPKLCANGTRKGGVCTEDAECPGSTCVFSDAPYTNVYVVAYNENAAPETEQIFNQLLENFNFNTNLKELYPGDYEIKKDQLRRDTIRKADAHYIIGLLSNYYKTNGKYPSLKDGTFVASHSVSTWPSWISTLGNALGSALPVDPLNYMSTTAEGQIDCVAHPNDCQVVCTRDEAGNPKTGCAQDKQCVADKYCSICPLGYDAQTCWDQTNLKFAYDVHKCSEAPDCGDGVCKSTENCASCPADCTCSTGFFCKIGICTCLNPKTCSGYFGRCGNLDDGCGGEMSCNCSNPSDVCNNGYCCTSNCTEKDAYICENNNLYNCQDQGNNCLQKVTVRDCTAEGKACNAASGLCQCIPNCTGKTCGDDGCGGSCGTCTGSLTCGGAGDPNNCGCADTTWSPDLGIKCGTFTQTSNCGNTRSATGTLTCAGYDTCGGGGTVNACGCTDTTWSPDPSTKCDDFTQTSNCGNTRTAAGTLTCVSPLTCNITTNSCSCTDTSWGPDPSTKCGDFTQTSNCGNTRTATGTLTCLLPQTCGGSGAANACGCTDTSWTPDVNTRCGTFTQTSNCGTTRSAIGTLVCTGYDTCGGGGSLNTCGCTHENAADFCTRLGKNCGGVIALDNCGTNYARDCGTCVTPQSCGGGGTQNVCGQANITLTGDNCFQLYINGEYIDETGTTDANGYCNNTGASYWSTPHTYALPYHSGDNIIAIKVSDWSGNYGLLARAFAGATTLFVSDAVTGWRCKNYSKTTADPANWYAPSFIETTWTTPIISPTSGSMPDVGALKTYGANWIWSSTGGAGTKMLCRYKYYSVY